MHELKPITAAGIPAALLKANRYRLLNESAAAESICEDILAVEPRNTEAIVTHVLAITDQFAASHGDSLARAREAVHQLQDPYKNAYYNGIGYCNITKCCTKVCPESIAITDNAIIPLKERVVDEHYDPIRMLLRAFRLRAGSGGGATAAGAS